MRNIVKFRSMSIDNNIGSLTLKTSPLEWHPHTRALRPPYSSRLDDKWRDTSLPLKTLSRRACWVFIMYHRLVQEPKYRKAFTWKMNGYCVLNTFFSLILKKLFPNNERVLFRSLNLFYSNWSMFIKFSTPVSANTTFCQCHRRKITVQEPAYRAISNLLDT